MIRTKCAWGLFVFGVGIGLISAVLLNTGICTVIFGLVFLVIGAVLINGS